MNDKPTFVFAIDSTTTDVVEIENIFRDEAKKDWLCPSCAQPRELSQIPPIRIKGNVKDLALNFIYGTGLGVIRKDFLKLLAQHHVEADVQLLTMLDPTGEEILNFKAFRAKKYILIRGEPRSSHRKCNECGRQLYHPLGKRYVLRTTWDNAALLGDQFNGFIVPFGIANHVKEMRWKEIAITKLPVLETPLDNLDLAP